MASLPSHAVVALTLGAWMAPRGQVRRALVAGAALAMVPDLDAIGYWLGVPSSSLIGHRGLTHSLTLALIGGLATAWLLTRDAAPALRRRLGWYFVVAMAAHGLVDAATNGGQGIAFLAPFSNARYFLPVRPIEVSPIGIEGVFGARGLRILASELRWILLPCALLAGLGVIWRRRPDPDRGSAADRRNRFGRP